MITLHFPSVHDLQETWTQLEDLLCHSFSLLFWNLLSFILSSVGQNQQSPYNGYMEISLLPTAFSSQIEEIIKSLSHNALLVCFFRIPNVPLPKKGKKKAW